ncbi:MAG TPA: ribbon-helix-helix protein, CopG family [Alcaligenaceae bacterium]|nr:ribbon-helix-helix protein, CopG family [Alcaligenaceae bacterium]
MTILANVSLRLPVDLIERIENLAKLTGRSRTFYMQEAIKQKLDDLEDIYLAEQALIDIRSGKSQTATLEDVMKRYGMEN